MTSRVDLDHDSYCNNVTSHDLLVSTLLNIYTLTTDDMPRATPMGKDEAHRPTNRNDVLDPNDTVGGNYHQLATDAQSGR